MSVYLLCEIISDSIKIERKTKPCNFEKQAKKRCKSYDEGIAKLLDEKREEIGILLERKQYTLELCDKIEEYLSIFCGFIWNLSCGNVNNSTSSTDNNQDDNQHNNENTTQLIGNNSGEATLIRETEKELVKEEIEHETTKPLSSLQHLCVYQWWSNLNELQPTLSSSLEFNDSVFEALMMLSTMAITLTIEAQKRITIDKKAAMKLVLKASSIWEYCSEELCRILKPFQPLPFLLSNNSNMCKMMQMISKAQAQEIGIFLLLDKGIENIESIGKLSRFVYKKYIKSIRFIKNEKECKVKAYLLFKIKYYDVMSHMYSAIYYNKKDENGMAIRLVDEALKKFESITKILVKELLKYVFESQEKELIEKQVSFLNSELKRYQEKYAKENSFVYHQTVPESVPELLVSKDILKIQSFAFPEPHEGWRNPNTVYKKFELKPLVLKKSVQKQKHDEVNIIENNSNVDDNNSNDFENDFDNVDGSLENQRKKRKTQQSTAENIGGTSLCIIL
ncbi:hypothetical protein ABK040_008885 [Willaertia magna]